MAGEARPAAARLEWLDLYRGLAVLVMIETHVCNTFLATAHWPVEWRVRLDYVNGLVAPAFLFIAGYAYGCGLRRKRAVRTHAGARLLRLGGVAAIGYAMHIPWPELTTGRWEEALRLGTRMDILPCLAFAIAALVIVDRFFEKRAGSVVAVMAGAVILLTQPAAGWTAAPVPLLALLNQNSGSLFPLLPWAAFTFCGFLASGVAPWLRTFAAARASSSAAVHTRPQLSTSLLLAAVLAAAALALARLEQSPASPAFFLQRLAWILVLVPVSRCIAVRWSLQPVVFAGRESLAIYVVHLLLISHLVLLGVPAMNLARVCALYLGIVASSFAIASGWRRFTVARADRARRAVRLPESSAPRA
jgi:uncharacterized membrane protein